MTNLGQGQMSQQLTQKITPGDLLGLGQGQMSQQLTQKITPGDLLGLGKCRVFPTKETTTVDPISNKTRRGTVADRYPSGMIPETKCRYPVNTVKYFEKYAACTLARSTESMCGPAAVYYTKPK